MTDPLFASAVLTAADMEVQSALKNWQEASMQHRQWKRRLVVHLLIINPDLDPYRKNYERFIPNNNYSGWISRQEMQITKSWLARANDEYKQALLRYSARCAEYGSHKRKRHRVNSEGNAE